MTARLGLLLTMLEPHPPAEEEFNNWYDTEHLPQRQAISGFLTLHRLVCIDGRPRYAALYDLTGTDVLDLPTYLAISGSNLSPWSKRVLGRIAARTRFEGTQIFPGNSTCIATSPRTVILGAKVTTPTEHEEFSEGLKAHCENRHDVRQLRVFQSRHDPQDLCAVVEGAATLSHASLNLAAAGPWVARIDLANVCVPYIRS